MLLSVTKKTPGVAVNTVTTASVTMQNEGYRLQVAALRTPAEAQKRDTTLTQ